METQRSQFNRNLLIILVLLYVSTIASFGYPLASEPEITEWWMIPLNLLILSIPLVLLYGSIYALVRGWHERDSPGAVSPRLAKIIHWAARVAAMMIIFFMSLFSLDVFGGGASPLEVLGAFLMHNIPPFVMIVFLAFLIAAILFTLFFVRDFFDLPNVLFFVFPILLIASLFYADWKWLKPSGVA